MIDSFMYFVHISSQLLNNNGGFGMIIPSTLLTQADMKALRCYLCDNFNLETVVNLGPKVFGPKVLNTSTILTFSKVDNSKINITVGDLRHNIEVEKQHLLYKIQPTNKKKWLEVVKSSSDYIYFTLNLPSVSLFQKLSKNFPFLREIIDGEIQRGISPDYLDAFIVEDEQNENNIETDILRPVVLGKHITRYGAINSSSSIIYLTRHDDIEKYPKTKSHLSRFRDKIKCREVEAGKHPWYSLHRPRNPEIFQSPKLIGLTTTKRICVVPDDEGYYATDALYLFKIKNAPNFNNSYVLGVLNSSLFMFVYHVSIQGEQRIIPQIKATRLYDLPFPVPKLSEKPDKIRHDKMVSLVDQMLDFHKQLAQAKLPQKKTVLKRQIEATDRQIDKLVYELYGLTEEEIKIVESGS